MLQRQPIRVTLLHKCNEKSAHAFHCQWHLLVTPTSNQDVDLVSVETTLYLAKIIRITMINRTCHQMKYLCYAWESI